VERPKSILTRNSSPDIGFDRSVNPYRGCEHGISPETVQPAIESAPVRSRAAKVLSDP
jgi:hypothetical protein